MITYTTLMGVATGTALILVPFLGLLLYRGRVPSLDGWALTLAALGVLLATFGGHMALTWPLTDPERYKNFLFGDPAALLGLLLIAAAAYLWRRGPAVLAWDRREMVRRLLEVCQPVAVLVLALGLALAAGTLAAVRYEIFATAPPQEPILGTWPSGLINAALCALYGASALGTLLAPLGVWWRKPRLLGVAFLAWTLAGAGWVALSVLVYFTHVALDVNLHPGG